MLAKEMNGKQVPSNTEVEICKWEADGYSFFIGFSGYGTYSGEFLLYVNNEVQYGFLTSPGNRTAYMADRAQRFKNGDIVSLRVIHDSPNLETFKGVILGGEY